MAKFPSFVNYIAIWAFKTNSFWGWIRGIWGNREKLAIFQSFSFLWGKKSIETFDLPLSRKVTMKPMQTCKSWLMYAGGNRPCKWCRFRSNFVKAIPLLYLGLRNRSIPLGKNKNEKIKSLPSEVLKPRKGGGDILHRYVASAFLAS